MTFSYSLGATTLMASMCSASTRMTPLTSRPETASRNSVPGTSGTVSTSSRELTWSLTT